MVLTVAAVLVSVAFPAAPRAAVSVSVAAAPTATTLPVVLTVAAVLVSVAFPAAPTAAVSVAVAAAAAASTRSVASQREGFLGNLDEGRQLVRG